MGNCVEHKGGAVNCIHTDWVLGDKCIPPKGKTCPKKSFRLGTNSDLIKSGERSVEAFLAERNHPRR